MMTLNINRQQLEDKLYYACRGDMRRVKELLKKGADVNWKDNANGWTALHVTCIWSRADIVMELLKYNPQLNQQDNNGDTALHFACRWGLLDFLKLFLATGECDLG